MSNSVTAKQNNIFEGKIVSTTIKMSIPILISQILAFSYIFVDTFSISLIDKKSTALVTGTGLVYSLYMIFYTLSRALYMGGSSVTARDIGENNEDSLKKIGDSALAICSVIMGLGLLFCLFFGKQFLYVLAGNEIKESTIQYGIEYFYYMIPCMLLMLLFNTLGGILQGMGMSKAFGVAGVLTTVTNIILNPVCIYIFNMGVKGAGLGSSISTLLGVIYFLCLFRSQDVKVKITGNIFHADSKTIKRILEIGIPSCIGMFLINISAMVLNKLIGSISEASLNAWMLVGKMDQLFVIPAYAIGLTTVPMIGQNIGRKNYKRTREIYKTNLLLCLGVCGVLGVIYVLISPFLFKGFSANAEVVEACVRQVRYLVIATIGLSGITVMGCSFQASGKPIPSLLSNVIRSVFSISPLLLSLVGVAMTDMTRVYLCIGIGNVIAFFFNFIWSNSYFKKIANRTV